MSFWALNKQRAFTAVAHGKLSPFFSLTISKQKLTINSSTIKNVWWEDVCEDAATFKHTSGTSYVIGGGAKGASDKIFQFNGRGTLDIKDFYANDYGKVVRSCGDCTNNGGPRNIILDGVVAKDGSVLCGINFNYGGKCSSLASRIGIDANFSQ